MKSKGSIDGKGEKQKASAAAAAAALAEARSAQCGDAPDPTDPMALSVTRHGNISQKTKADLLAAGIDTLDLGFYVDWGAGWFELQRNLEHHKLAAAGSPGGLLWRQLGGEPSVVYPSGKAPMYRYHLGLYLGHLYIGKARCSEKYPTLFVSLHARMLWEEGPAKAIELVSGIVRELGGVVIKVVPSRVDLAADFHIPGGLDYDFLREYIVPQDSARRVYSQGDQLETFYHGSTQSGLQLRIYDKAKEIDRPTGKVWMRQIWRRQVEVNIWRVEFQIRRVVLRQYDVSDYGTLERKLAGIWHDLTTNWASLREKDNENVSRRSFHPLWLKVQAAAERFGEIRNVRRGALGPTLAPSKWYASHACGCAVGLAAQFGVATLDEALERLATEVRKQLTQEDFSLKLQKKLMEAGRPFSQIRDEREAKHDNAS